MSTCQICLSNKRKIKFASSRIKICQNCVTLIQGRSISPDKITSDLFKMAQNYVRKPIKLNATSLWEKAEYNVRNREALIDTIINMIFTTSKRTAMIEEEFARLTILEENAYTIAMNEYKKEIKATFDDIISGEFEQTLKHHPRRYNYEISNLEKTYKIMKDGIKLLRAFLLKLHSGDKLTQRIEEDVFRLTRRLILEKDGYECAICRLNGSREVELQVHHIIPIDKFGTNDSNNLITLCYSCHNKQHRGFKVTRHIRINRSPANSEFVAVDVETTGLNHSTDGIIEVAAIRFNKQQEIDRFISLVNPGISIPRRITEITGIDEAMVSAAPKISWVIREFIKFVGKSPLVGHNIKRFDMKFLTRFANESHLAIDNKVIDTLDIARKKLPRNKFPDLRDHKLETLVSYFGIPINGTHKAYADALAVALLYISINTNTKR